MPCVNKGTGIEINSKLSPWCRCLVYLLGMNTHDLSVLPGLDLATFGPYSFDFPHSSLLSRCRVDNTFGTRRAYLLPQSPPILDFVGSKTNP